MPAEAVQALFKCSNGNVCMKTRLTSRGWERALVCEDCDKTQSVEALIVLERSDDAAFQRILNFCAEHRHDSHARNANVDVFETVKMNTGRRVKEI